MASTTTREEQPGGREGLCAKLGEATRLLPLIAIAVAACGPQCVDVTGKSYALGYVTGTRTCVDAFMAPYAVTFSKGGSGGGDCTWHQTGCHVTIDCPSTDSHFTLTAGSSELTGSLASGSCAYGVTATPN